MEIDEEFDVPEEMKSVHQKTNIELLSWRIAARRLLAGSNATVIRNHNDKGYGCGFCREQFPDPAELKKHSHEKHKPETFIGDKVQARFFLKLDITNLKCNLCEEKFTTSDQIITHLNESHRKRPEFSEIATETKVKLEEVIVKMEIDDEVDVTAEVKNVNQKTNLELLSWRIAVRSLLASSNATVIRNYTDKGYGCGFCPEQFRDPSELKKHSHEKHKAESFMGDRVQARFFVKMDITNLKCNLCEEKFTTSEQIITHLNESHTKNILPDIKNLIMPFKFEDNELRCKRREFHERASENQVKFEEVTIKTEIKEKVKSPAVKEKENKKRIWNYRVGELRSGLCWPAVMPRRFGTTQIKVTGKRREYGENASDKEVKFEEVNVKYESKDDANACAPVNREKRIPNANLELQSWRVAVRSVLACSNATVIRNHTDKGYGCCFCREQFPDPAELKTHYDKHTADIPKFKGNLQSHMHSHYSNYICDVCSAGFVTKKSLLVHRASHETGNVKCSYCSKVFDSQHKAKQHESYVHKETVPRSVCRFCNERFKRYTAKQKHLEEVHGVAPMSFKCLACDKLFARKHLLHAHTKRFHLMLRPHKCIECGGILLFVRDESTHGKERAFTEKTSETKHEFEEVTVKTEIRAEVDAPVVVKERKSNFICDICSAGFVTLKTLLVHRASHETASVKCSYCPKVFDSQSKAKQHESAIHKKCAPKSVCRFCNERFKTYNEKQKHLQKVHGVAPITIKCPACDKWFAGKRRVTEKTSKTNVQFEEVSVKEESDEAVFASTVKKKINVNANLELECWRVAVRGLLASSNATAIRNHSDKGYGCCFCREQFQDPAELKTHNTEKHIADIAKFKGVKEQSKFFVKMDITNLKCNICEGEFTTIEQLITHLNEEHSLNIFPDIKRLILPFKFDSKELCCCECWQTFHIQNSSRTHAFPL
ncbi:hypothetical protein NE865_15857 [Phthorimaea operculella]|nr:hypothetical protein NE865_15857 [Phthorimaea operculella]